MQILHRYAAAIEVRKASSITHENALPVTVPNWTEVPFDSELSQALLKSHAEVPGLLCMWSTPCPFAA